MKTIGLIGGMSWESTLEYYRLINEAVKSLLGGLHSAKILLYSVDFQEIEEHQSRGRWQDSAALLADAAQRLERGGSDFILICTNTMHKVAPEVASAINIPLVHIADAAAEAIRSRDFVKVGLLGTRFTMEQDFLTGRFLEHGIETIVPDEKSRLEVHRIIYDELCRGRIEESSRKKLIRIISDLQTAGSQGVVLGCTEIPLLIQPENSVLPLFDTTAIHAQKAVDMALEP